jgi:hypothetical protein
LFKDINTKNQILKLVYSINSEYSLQQENHELQEGNQELQQGNHELQEGNQELQKGNQELQQGNLNQEQDLNQKREQAELQEQEINNIYQKISILLDKHKDNYILIYYEFNTYNIPDNKLFNLKFKLDDYIYFLPNIFVHTSEYTKYFNMSGFAFIHLFGTRELLLIPWYLTPFYIDRFKIYDLQLNIINTNIKYVNYTTDDNEFISFMKNHDLIKLFNFKFNGVVIRDDSFIIPIISYYFIQHLLKLNQMNKLYNLRNIIVLNIDNIIVYVNKYLKNKSRYLQIFRELIKTSDRILQREFYLYDIDKEIETEINTKYNFMLFDGPLEPITSTDNKTSHSDTNNITFKEIIDDKWYRKYLKYKKKYLSLI